ncbi:MAG: CaiB/BaiF CoA transferase family protein [Sphingobium sp.]
MGQGPLSGVRIVEFAGIGPGPFCGMLLSDLGADVIRIDRLGADGGGVGNVTARGRRSLAFDLKDPASIATCLDLIEKADALFEGFRPGVMERLGLGPDVALARNPKLVYGRMTGWGQTGPLAQAAGHDINYIAISGALHAIGTADKPVPPLNVVGDFGGGSLYLAMGLLAGVINARATGKGQVVDCAIADGAASLMSMFYGFNGVGRWKDRRGANLLDGGAHFYNSYRCADGGWIALGSIEPQFYALLVEKAGLDETFLPQMDRDRWPELTDRLTEIVALRTRDEWCALLEGTDACFAPVLGIEEAPAYSHNVARGLFVEVEGIVQPGPVPRFSETPGAVQGPPPIVGAHTDEVLRDWGVGVPDKLGE